MDALVGFETELTHLDSHKVKISRDGVTWPGARMRKPNEGMPNYENNNKKGTLYVTFNVKFPTSPFSEEQKQSKNDRSAIVILPFRHCDVLF